MNPFSPSTFSKFGPDAKVWIFTLAREISADEADQLLARVNTFLSGWTAHKRELSSTSAVIDSQILLVVADTSASGCSIDALFSEVSAITADLDLQLPPLGSIVVKNSAGEINVYNRSDLRQAFKDGKFDLSGQVLNSSASTLAEISGGVFQTIEGSPYARLL